MNILDELAGKNRLGLARAIQGAVQNYTTNFPMAPDEVAAVIALCAGIMAGKQPPENRERCINLITKFVIDGYDIGTGKVSKSPILRVDQLQARYN